MQFGVHLPHLGRQAERDTIRGFAQRVEALGFASAWVSDHITWPAAVASRYPYSANGDFPAPFNVPWLEPIGTLLFVAGCTERLRLGTTVLILGYRPPVQTAKLLSTLDVLSGGRVILGVGVGWMREEFEALGMPFDHRGARADEQLEVFDALFTQDLPSYSGRFYQFPEVGFQPKPPHGHLPIWVGGHTDAAFTRTARYGDGFHAAFQTADVVAHEWAQVRAACAAQGRDPAALELSVRLYLGDYGGVNKAVAIAGDTDQMLAQIDAWARIGVTHLVLDPVAPRGVPGRLEALERFAADVLPRAGAKTTA